MDTVTVRTIGGVTAVVGALVVGASLSLWLDNLEGPFGEHGGLGAITALACAALSGGVLYLSTTALARRSTLTVVAWTAALVCAAVVLVPQRIDVSESFVPRPNERSSCSGLAFRHYPPGTMDASTVTYCVGIEHPLPAG